MKKPRIPDMYVSCKTHLDHNRKLNGVVLSGFHFVGKIPLHEILIPQIFLCSDCEIHTRYSMKNIVE